MLTEHAMAGSFVFPLRRNAINLRGAVNMFLYIMWLHLIVLIGSGGVGSSNVVSKTSAY